ncbi:hypothetical protein OPV22_030398 [Ensete ventricosum]|uniref:Uncharacterized protein n=1 Tax=Ensete ventricosum TaxID=4639 RepID=A0AAV8Q5Z8_ENSVE|nr:hypothetical protein OPV22_030398 [Ensete ventricosum]
MSNESGGGEESATGVAIITCERIATSHEANRETCGKTKTRWKRAESSSSAGPLRPSAGKVVGRPGAGAGGGGRRHAALTFGNNLRAVADLN